MSLVLYAPDAADRRLMQPMADREPLAKVLWVFPTSLKLVFVYKSNKNTNYF